MDNAGLYHFGRFPSVRLTVLLATLTIASALTGAGVAAGAETDEVVFSSAGTNRSGQPVRYLERIRADGTGRERFSIRARNSEGLFAPGMRNYDPVANDGVEITELAQVNWGNVRELRRPKVSSRGRKLLFRSAWTVHAANWDGGGYVNLFPYLREWYMGAWSPDGLRVAAVSDITGNAEIWTAAADGSGLSNLTNSPRSSELAPAWSPDGRELAFISNRNGRFELWRIAADGEHARRICGVPEGDVRDPAWSVRNEIAFAVQRPDGTSSLYLVRPDGTGLRRLTEGPWWDGQPDWDCDGARLAFVSNRDGVANIHLREPDGAIRNLTHGSTDEYSPCWVPRQISAAPVEIDRVNSSGRAYPRPRLLFRAEMLPDLRSRLRTEPYKRPFEALLKRCDAPPAPGARGWERSAAELGFAWQVTGLPEYGARGAKLLTEGMRRLLLTDPDRRELPIELACAFDWLESALAPADRDSVRTALNHYLGIHLAYIRSYFFDSAGMSDGASNFATYASASGMLALAMTGEPGCPPGALADYLRLIRRNAENWLDANGGCRESYSYFVMPTRAALPFLCSLRLHPPVPAFLNNSNLARFPEWMALGQVDGAFPNLGDSDRMRVQFSEGFLQLYPGHPVLQKLWNLQPRPSVPESSPLGLLWFAPSRHDPAPDWGNLPLVQSFPGPGFTVFRSGFAPGSTVAFFSTAAGGHAHNEAGALTLYAFGRSLLTDPGQGVRDAEFHNQLLIDGIGRRPNYGSAAPSAASGAASVPYGFTAGVDLVRPFADAVSGHTDPDYADPLPGVALRRGSRRVMWVAGDTAHGLPPYLIVADSAEPLRAGRHRFEQIWITDRDFQPVETAPGVLDFAIRPAEPAFTADMKRPGSLDFRFDVPERGRYVLFYRGYEGALRGFSGLLDGKIRLNGRGGPAVTREYVTQWIRAVSEPVELSGGTHTLSVHQAANLSAIAWVPERSAAAVENWGEPANPIPASSATRLGERFSAATRDLRLRLAQLDGSAGAVTVEPIRYRTRFYGQIPIELTRTRIRRDGASGSFLTLIYPWRPGMPEPKCLRGAVEWPGATDTVTIENGEIVLRRTLKNHQQKESVQ